MNRSVRVRRTSGHLLREKYYHSRGAECCAEGRFGQAIRFFRKALLLDDQAYSRAHLALAYEEKGDIGRALKEISKALHMSPSVVEYYVQRARLWQKAGKVEKAEDDYRAALKADPNISRLESIRLALQKIERAFAGTDHETRADLGAIRHPLLKAVLMDRSEAAARMQAAVEHRSCIVRCPAYCCHFSKETFLHGLFFGSWKLHAVKQHLREKGLRETDFLGKIAVSESDRALRLIPPDRMLPQKGQVHVYFPRRTRASLGSKLSRMKPRGRGYHELSWITEKSRACAFLAEGRCTIHDVGDDPALSSCKEFLCLTGLVFLVLDHLAVVDRKVPETGDMAGLNRIAVEAAQLMAHRLFDDEDLRRMDEHLAELVTLATVADERGEAARCGELATEYRRLEAAREMRWLGQIGLLREDILGLVASDQGPGPEERR